jgi:hypothetical protein
VEHPPLIDEVPLCACGCGRAVQLASANDKRTGAVRGKPLRFIRGHHAHGRPFIRPPQYVEVDTGYTTPCHLWGAKVCHWGYGVLRSGMTGKTYRAHRAIYEAFVRPLGPKEVLDHLCRQKTCVNVEHLEPVPQRTNQRRGNAAKLTVDAVLAIRASTLSHVLLARNYGVSPTTICGIRTGRSWRNLIAD